MRASSAAPWSANSAARSVAIGPGAPTASTDRAPIALLAGIQGGVGIMLATGDLGCLEAALDTGIGSLRS
jgi:hypothetical protein